MNRFILLISALSVACSGADGAGLLDEGGLQDIATGTDAAVQQNDASTSNDASTVSDVQVADVGVADVKPDLFVGPADSKIQCGPSLTCSAQNQTCCWHQSSTTKPYECVTDVSACAGTYDAPITCSTHDNCASQGNPSYTCCATGGNFGFNQCAGYDVASIVACKATCDITDYQVGCSVTLQNCSDTTQTCIVSKCTDPGTTICN
jgi:hypothetical protein